MLCVYSNLPRLPISKKRLKYCSEAQQLVVKKRRAQRLPSNGKTYIFIQGVLETSLAEIIELLGRILPSQQTISAYTLKTRLAPPT